MPKIPEFKIFWEFKNPPILVPQKNPDWLENLSELRGRVLYENGRRPYFKNAEQELQNLSSYVDTDHLDSLSYHILARHNGNIIGCIRLLPLSPANPVNCVIGQEIQDSEFLHIWQEIKKLNLENRLITEASRWIVDPQFKHTMIGTQLLYGIWGLSLELNSIFIANGGLNAYKLVSHFGAVPIPNSKIYYSKKYNDDLSVFYFDHSKLSLRILQSIEKMKIILNLSSSLLPKQNLSTLSKKTEKN